MTDLTIFSDTTSLTETEKLNRKSAAEASKKVLQDEIKSSSRRRYQAVHKLYEQFCLECKVNHTPLYDEAVQNIHTFISSSIQNKGIKSATVSVYKAALADYFTKKGYDPLPTKSPRLRKIINSAKNINPYTPRKVKALTSKNIRAMIDKCDLGTTIGVRDRAIIALAFCGGFRRSEIAALRMQDIKEKDTNGYTFNLDNTKTGPVEKKVKGGKNLPLFEYLQAWIDLAEINEGRIFYEISKSGRIIKIKPLIGVECKKERDHLSPETISNILKKYAAMIGIDPKIVAGHSTRRGIATESFRNGANVKSVQSLLGHAKPEMSIHYQEKSSDWEDHATNGVFDKD